MKFRIPWLIVGSVLGGVVATFFIPSLFPCIACIGVGFFVGVMVDLYQRRRA